MIDKIYWRVLALSLCACFVLVACGPKKISFLCPDIVGDYNKYTLSKEEVCNVYVKAAEKAIQGRDNYSENIKLVLQHNEKEVEDMYETFSKERVDAAAKFAEREAVDVVVFAFLEQSEGNRRGYWLRMYSFLAGPNMISLLPAERFCHFDLTFKEEAFWVGNFRILLENMDGRLWR